MDLFSGLISFWTGLVTSSLIIIQLFTASASAYLTSLSSSLDSFLASYSTETTSPPLSSPQDTSTHSNTTTPSTTVASTTTASNATTTQKTIAQKPAAAQPVASAPAPTQKTPLTPLLPPEQVNTAARASIVNILCMVQSSGSLRSISGSGVIIDARGVILTNAHIGQYFLLRDYPTKDSVSCVVRTGSPATPAYSAALLYLPLAWINENASQISAEQALGTGENDYAFLHITGPINPQAALPAAFSNIAMSGSSLDTGDQVLVAGYPAGFLDAITIERNLYATSAFTAIGQLYTFDSPTTIDVVSLGGTVVSQGGSSGGAVVRTYDGKLAGLISTATTGTTTASRDLRAITIGYINRSLTQAGKGGLVEFLSGDLVTIAANFASTLFVEEKKKLVEALSR
jgi:hypothetical protein